MRISGFNLKTLKFWMAVAVFGILSTILAAAQQYQIVHADYGFQDQRVDVTQRLRDIARSNATFRMGNDTFGVDPAPGYRKTLRIFARGPQGDQTFEFPEGGIVDGSQFAGWGRGDWGNGANNFQGGDGRGDRDEGQYVILHAEYGTERNHVDVTERLRQLARADRTFVMGNDTFGVDPDHGHVKTLRIYTRGPDGQERLFEFQEKSIVDGTQFRGWGRGDWGNDAWHGEWAGGGSQGGMQGGGFHGDRDRDEGQFVILRAEYGTRRHHVDVTDRLRQLARTDRTFIAGNDSFGIDPDHGKVKTLSIFTRGPDGQERVFQFREKSPVDGSQFKGWSGGDWR